MNKNWPDHRRASTVGALVAALWAVTPQAHALTLGRAVIQSPLGVAMRAEIEFENLSVDEAESLRANIASAETYRLSGVDYNPSLAGARVVLQRLSNRRASLRITTDRAIQEPFLELILEINWRGGRLVRSYTLLFDLPPSTRGVANPAAIGSNDAVPASPAFPPMATPTPSASPAPSPTFRPTPSRATSGGLERNAAMPPASRRGPPPAGSPPAPALVDDPYRVRAGDTLSELAQRGARPAGVSLDRLVLAMYRDNPDAFLGGNMHRLRNGAVLSAPDMRTVDGITDAEARRVIRAQSADFNGYRHQLAAMPAERAESSGRSASGKVQSAVEDRKQAALPTPDKLTLSKPSAASAADAAQVSRQRERQDAATRVAELSKNVQDLGRLSGTAGAPSASAAAPVSLAPAAPGASGGLVLPGLTSPGVMSPAASAASVQPSPASAPASAAILAASASSPAASAASAPRPRSTPKPAPPPPPPDLMDSLLEDNLPAVGLAGALILGLAGFGLYRLVKRKRGAAPETSFLESRLKPDSFFGASEGQKIDTREAAGTGATSSLMNYSLSQLDAIGDVDPVAEADVYLAYGRDLQAEEILKEAMRTTPERMAIRTKLLEVYAKRRDVNGFEQLARQLHGLTGGTGDDWKKASEMGRQLDPGNPLYGAAEDGSAESAPLADEAATGRASLPPTLPLASRPPDNAPTQPAANSTFDLDLDLDLGMDDVGQTTMPIDTDATLLAPPAARPAAPPAAGNYVPVAEDMLTFSTPTGFGTLPPTAAPPAATPVSPRPAPAASDAAPFSASTFALDLDLPEPSGLSAGPSMLPPIEGFDAPRSGAGSQLDAEPDFESDDPLARKLELADEFRQIGDLEGARDLLQEVIDRADGALKVKAQSMLASLS